MNAFRFSYFPAGIFLRQLRRLIACLLACGFVSAGAAIAAVTHYAAGPTAEATTSLGAPIVAWPTHAIDDVALLFVETPGGEPVTLAVASGFVEIPNSPQATGSGTAGTRLTVFWARATSAAMSSVTLLTAADHVYAQILTFRGVVNTGNPWDVIGGGVKASASTSISVTGVTTTVANTLIVQAVARDNDNATAAFSLQTNATLGTLTERVDGGTSNGNGGGLGVWTGVMATAGATGNTAVTVTSSINAFITIALKPQPRPYYQAAGTAVGGTAAVTPTWPAHEAGDIALLFVESAGGEPVTLSTPAGFVQVTNSPQATGAGTAGTRLTVFWARATSSAMTAPVVADPGDHVYARILTFRGVASSGNPWDVTGGGVKTPASTSLTVTGVTTTVANTLIVQAAVRDIDGVSGAVFSAQTNATLGTLTERHDAGTVSNNGGGFAVWDGFQASAGATGNTTVTVTSSINAFLTLALKPGGPPSYQAQGTAVQMSLNWPNHQAGDIALLFVESAGGQPVTLAVANGFTEITNSPQSTGTGTAGTRLTVYWARATSATMIAPTINGTTDHIYAQIHTFRGAIATGNPWDVTAGGVKASASTSVSVTGVTTTAANTLVVQAVARDIDNVPGQAFSGQTNASLTSITERSDAGTTLGLGGGFSVWTGNKATAGVVATTTATVTSSINAFMTIALKPPIPVDHYELSVPASNLSCMSSTVTVTACADSSRPCTSIATAITGTATLATSAGALAATSPTFASGVASTTLTHTAATNGSTVTVTLSGETQAATNSRVCCMSGTCTTSNTCTPTFNTAALMVSDSVGGAVATIPTQVAGTTSATFYARAIQTNTTTKACEAALSGAQIVQFAYECLNPSTCSASNQMSISGTGISRNNSGNSGATTGVSLTFDANGNAPFTLRFDDVGQTRLHLSKAASGTLLTSLSGTSNAFVTRPSGFTLTATCSNTANTVNAATGAATDAAFCRAGQNFNVTATAINSANAVTPNYGRETTPETIGVTWSLHLPSSGSGGTLPSGTLSLSSTTNGTFGPTTMSWDEVGILKADVNVGDGDYLGAGAPTALTAYVGRFFPDHFDLVLTPLSGCTGFVYGGRSGQAGQPFSVKATARSTGGNKTTNYAGAFAGAVNLALTAGGTAGRLFVDNTAGGTGAIPATKFVSGEAQINATDTSGRISYGFDAALTGETSITLRADNAESPAASAVANGTTGSTIARMGRLRLANAAGSELAPLMMPAQMEYYDAANEKWLLNTSDSCTPFATLNGPAVAVPLSAGGATNVRCGVPDSACTTASGSACNDAASKVSSGAVALCLTAPSVAGNANIEFNPPDYLKYGTTDSPLYKGRAVFGVKTPFGKAGRVVFRSEER